jgi:hypothetical protein
MGATQQMGGHRANGPAPAQEGLAPMHSKPIQDPAPDAHTRPRAVKGGGNDG